MNGVHDELATTITRALTDAERASVTAAGEALARGDIQQEEVGPGVWRLTRSRVEVL